MCRRIEIACIEIPTPCGIVVEAASSSRIGVAIVGVCASVAATEAAARAHSLGAVFTSVGRAIRALLAVAMFTILVAVTVRAIDRSYNKGGSPNVNSSQVGGGGGVQEFMQQDSIPSGMGMIGRQMPLIALHTPSPLLALHAPVSNPQFSQ